MSLISLLETPNVVGIALWTVHSDLPVDKNMKTAVAAIVEILLVLRGLRSFGLLKGIGRMDADV